MSDRLDKAISDFEDETLDLTLGERISGLGEALMYNSYERLKRVPKDGIKDPQADAEDYRHTECMKRYREIERLYTYKVKMNKLLGKKDDNMDKDFLKKIKELKSSIGDIVRDIQPILTNGKQ